MGHHYKGTLSDTTEDLNRQELARINSGAPAAQPQISARGPVQQANQIYAPAAAVTAPGIPAGNAPQPVAHPGNFSYKFTDGYSQPEWRAYAGHVGNDGSVTGTSYTLNTARQWVPDNEDNKLPQFQTDTLNQFAREDVARSGDVRGELRPDQQNRMADAHASWILQQKTLQEKVMNGTANRREVKYFLEEHNKAARGFINDHPDVVRGMMGRPECAAGAKAYIAAHPRTLLARDLQGVGVSLGPQIAAFPTPHSPFGA